MSTLMTSAALLVQSDSVKHVEFSWTIAVIMVVLACTASVASQLALSITVE